MIYDYFTNFLYTNIIEKKHAAKDMDDLFDYDDIYRFYFIYLSPLSAKHRHPYPTPVKT